jgi:hypothetical protein
MWFLGKLAIYYLIRTFFTIFGHFAAVARVREALLLHLFSISFVPLGVGSAGQFVRLKPHAQLAPWLWTKVRDRWTGM